jgi:Zn-dependent protease
VFLAEPPRTPYDLAFPILGFSVRVTPFFWLVAAILGYDESRALDGALRDSSPGQFVLLLMWIAAVFVSILIHELGHAIAIRYYGENAYVILYHFGGLAVPDGGGSFARPNRTGRHENQIVISLAGPAAQILLALVIILAVRLTGYKLGFFVWPLDELIPPPDGKLLPSPLLAIALYFLIAPSIWWALINLLPIFPLDGGQVVRSALMLILGAEGFRYALMVSIATAAALALYFFSLGSTFNALLFVSLAVSSFQLLQMLRFGGGSW